MRRVGGWLVVVAVLCGWSAGTAVASSQTYFAHYKGDLSDQQTLTGLTTPQGSITDTLNLTWDEKVYANHLGQITQRTLLVQGTFTVSGTGADAGYPDRNYSCMIRQRSGNMVGDLSVGPGDTAREANVTGHIPIAPGPGGDVVFSAISDPGGVCQTFNSSGSVLHWNSDGSGSGNCSSFTADPNFIPGFAVGNVRAAGASRSWLGTQSMTPLPYACDSTVQTETGSRSIHATLTVGAGGPPPPPPGHPLRDVERTRQKLLAKVDLHNALRTGPDLCGQTAIGLTALWAAGQGAPLSPSQVATAKQMLAAAGPGCAAVLQRAYDDFQIAHDPPDSRFSVLAWPRPIVRAASLPGCSTPAAVRAYCVTLRTDLAHYIKAAERAASIDDALKTTVFRERAAANARNRSALKRQDAHGKKLESQFQAAVRSEVRLGVATARLIAAHHVHGQLTTTQDATAINFVVTRLERRSIAPSLITKLAGQSLRPSPLDLLARLR